MHVFDIKLVNNDSINRMLDGTHHKPGKNVFRKNGILDFRMNVLHWFCGAIRCKRRVGGGDDNYRIAMIIVIMMIIMMIMKIIVIANIMIIPIMTVITVMIRTNYSNCNDDNDGK